MIDHTNRRVLEVLENREKSTVQAYLQKGKESGLFAGLEEVTTDMWDGYVAATRAVFGPSVALVIDRFHVMKNLQEQLTNARREVQRGLSAEERKALKGSRWLWQTNWENLDSDQQAALTELKKRFPQLQQLADQREALRALFEDRQIADPSAGESRLRQWLEAARRLGLASLNRFCQTLERWLEPIANYFRRRSSNGRTEGFNHGLRSILWRAFGMGNFRHFRLRVLDGFGRSEN